MLPSDHQAARQRILELGRSGKADALPELTKLLALPSNDLQRLAVSAIGKLAEFGADAEMAVAALAPLAKQARHPQTQQYAIRALVKYGAWGAKHVHDLRDVASNSGNKDYVRAATATAADAIELATQDESIGIKHRCQRCGATLSEEEHVQAQVAFQRNFCARCFDEVFLERRNFETQVEINKTIEARDGTLVQSKGEKCIAERLTTHRLTYRYDSKCRIVSSFQIRPDFYLPELDVYIEYWGLDTPQYKMAMHKKQILYQQEGKKLVSVYPKDLHQLDLHLRTKLRLFGFRS